MKTRFPSSSQLFLVFERCHSSFTLTGQERQILHVCHKEKEWSVKANNVTTFGTIYFREQITKPKVILMSEDIVINLWYFVFGLKSSTKSHKKGDGRTAFGRQKNDIKQTISMVLRTMKMYVPTTFCFSLPYPTITLRD